MIGLCDCNNFFVSCQRVFRPDLNGVPVAVLSGNDGCVIARSNEVKALGIKMGVPLFEVKDIVKKHNVVLFSANHRLYADMSCRVMDTLRQQSSSIEVYSIDEAFIDFSEFDVSSLKAYGERLAALVKRNTGIPVSIGIAPTKTLAKIASRLCKQYPKLNNACLMYRQEDIEKVLKKLPIGDVWGIGRKTLNKLSSIGIVTAFDFTQLSEQRIQTLMGITGVRTWRELRSIPSVEFTSTLSAHQSISIGRSFAKEVCDFHELHSFVSTFATTVAEKLRKQKSCVRQITTYIYTNRHKTNEPQHYESDTVRLEVPTDSTIEIVSLVHDSLRKIFKEGFRYKKAGVICSNLTVKNQVEHTLFDTIDRGKHTKLMESIDRINAKHGSKSILLASENNTILESSKNHLSPCYTTEWEDIIYVKQV